MGFCRRLNSRRRRRRLEPRRWIKINVCRSVMRCNNHTDTSEDRAPVDESHIHWHKRVRGIINNARPGRTLCLSIFNELCVLAPWAVHVTICMCTHTHTHTHIYMHIVALYIGASERDCLPSSTVLCVPCRRRYAVSVVSHTLYYTNYIR